MSKNIGTCKVCNSNNVNLLDVSELLDFFQELIDNFQTIDNLKTGTDYRKSVLDCYKQMCNWMNGRGVRKVSHQTPREFAMTAKNFLNVSPESLYNLTQIFEKARYSTHDINVEDRDKAIKCLNEIIAAPVNVQVNTQADTQVNTPVANTGIINK